MAATSEDTRPSGTTPGGISAARAEAERRYRGPRMHVGTATDREIAAYVDGWQDGAAGRAETTTGRGSCPLPDCEGDARYAPPGRGHRDGCTYLSAETTTEWAHRLENGGAAIWPTRAQAEADRDDFLTRPRDPFEPAPPRSVGIWRREVTAWTETP